MMSVPPSSACGAGSATGAGSGAANAGTLQALATASANNEIEFLTIDLSPPVNP
jgi:hypothetical protein